MEQIFFLVLVAAVGLARWFLQEAEKRKNTEAERQAGEPGSATPSARAPAQSEEERVRRFFEALGVPTSSSPPPKVQPRQITPKKPRAKTISPIDPFPMPRTGGLPPPLIAPLPTATPEAPPVPKHADTIVPERITATARTAPVATNFEVHDIDEGWLAESNPGAISTSSPPGIGARLATTEGLRDAIVLREIFGPPRSMQPFSHSALG